MESLFGAEIPFPVKFFIAFLFVLALIIATAWVVRRFGGQRLDAVTRGRQPRLSVIDAAAVDSRRRLILIRRDNMEHLLMIGGPTDVVIEPNIVRAAPAGREAPPLQRSPAAADALPRAILHGDSAPWSQGEARPQRGAHAEDSEPWTADAEPPPHPAAPPRRAARAADPLAAVAAEATRFPELRAPDMGGREGGRHREAPREVEVDVEREPVRASARERESLRQREPSLRGQPGVSPREQSPRDHSPREQSPREQSPRDHGEAVRERPQREREAARTREVAQPAQEEEFSADTDQNLAAMAQRLEAALRRPNKAGEPREAEPRAVNAEAEAAPPPLPRPAPPVEPKPAKSLYDSLEKEMASLLGRPSGNS